VIVRGPFCPSPQGYIVVDNTIEVCFGGLTIGEIDGEICLRLDKSKGRTYLSMLEMFSRWANEAKKLEAGEITREEYDHWRYTYPAVEAQRTRDELDALRAKRKAAETEE